MIYQNEYWYDIVPSIYDDEKKIGSIDGKWLYFDDTEKLHALLEDLNLLVESGEIRAAKIARKLPEFDPFPEKPCVLCVFTSNNREEKERVKALLKTRLGISVDLWKSEEQTRRDWREGGWLQIQFEISKIRRGIEAGTVADVQSAQKRMLELTRQLENMIETINDPERKAEIDLNKVHDVRRKTEASLSDHSEIPEVIISRLASLEEVVTAILSKMESGEIGYERKLERSDANYIFVIMPFSDEHIDTYDAIKRAVEKAGQHLKAERVDEKPGAIAITDEIHRSIQRASVVICDLTNERPNVYYELGFAKGVNKQLICIAREGTQVHFDVYGLKIVFFRTYRELEQKLATEIKKLLKPNTAV